MQPVAPLWSNSRYEIWWRGVVAPDKVTLSHDSEDELTLNSELEQQVYDFCRQARKEGRKVEPLPLYRTVQIRGSETALHIEAGLCNYEQYLGLGGLRVAEPQAVSLAIAAATLSDRGWILERRSSRVAEGVGLLHVKPSGHVHPPQSPWEAVIMEAGEELALAAKELHNPVCVGLIRGRTAQCWGLIYTLSTPVAFCDILRRSRIDDWESQELLTISADPEALTIWLVENYEKVTGIGHGSLLLAGWQRYGDDWFQRTWDQLPQVSS